MMGGPGIGHMQQLQHQRMMGNAQQQQGMMGAQLARMGQQGMMGGPQHRMAGPSVHPQGMMGAQQHRMGMPGVSQQGMMGAQHPRMVSPVVSQQGIMGAHPRMASPVLSQQGIMGAHPRMVSPVVNQQGMMGAQHPRMAGPGVCQQGMMGNQMLRPGVSQQSMMGTAQPRMLGATAQSLGMDPRVNQQLMMQRQQQRMMGPAVSQQSMIGMQQQRMIGVNQQRSVGPGQMQQGMMGAQPHGPHLPQQSMMGTTDGSHLGAQQQRIMVTILPEHGAVGPSSQRIVESTHGVSERQVIEIKTSGDALIDSQWEKQNGATRSNNVNIVISPQEDLPRYDAPSSTANTVSPRASTLRTLVEVPLSFDTGVSEKQVYTKDVDHRLLKPDLDPGILKDGDVDYRTLVPIRPAEEEDLNILETTPDKPSSTKDIPLKLLVKLKPLKPLQKAPPPVETSKAEPKIDPENSSPTKDSKDPPKPGLVPVPSKGSANKSKITLKLIDRTAKQKRTEEDVTYGSIPALLDHSVQMRRLSLSMEPTQQEILSALEEDCGCMNLFSPQVEQTITEKTEMSDNKPIRLLSLSELSAEDKTGTVQELVETKVCPSLREEDIDISSSPEVFGVLSVPATEPEMVATSTEPDHLFSSDSKSGETPTELSENHNIEQTQDESEDNLRENLPFQTHSKGPLKSFPLASQDKEERQARDDELIQTSLDAMVEPSEVQNIAISFKNPIAEAFEPNKPGSPLLSLALKLTRLHKRNVAKSYNGKHLRRTISVIEEGMENRNTGVKEKNNPGKELRPDHNFQGDSIFKKEPAANFPAPPNKFSEGSMEPNTLQEQSKNGVQGEIQVEETTSSKVRKVTFSEADYSQDDPSTWPQGISLQAMKHVVLVDLGCWPQFFQSLPKGHLEDTFVWGFQDAKTSWRPPISCDEYCRLSRKRHFFLHPPCGSVDSAICMVAGKLDSYLPRHLPFTLLPGPPGFAQLQQRWKKCRREGNLINPNTADLQNILQHLFSTEDSSTSTS
ncbi:ZNF451 [Branchiostoma lanceolatum]|uniref:ZNF451 protein n=1 Tax=Branchiostoma lanceolatum TaxID=7740 RepID=A0A8J9ZCD7_BRALA|nr:ZNF451 [Branchiostoma lanceolatum]